VRFSPLGISLAALILAYSISTIFSVNPSESFWGSYNYMEGTFSFFCLVALFGFIACQLRSENQLTRLVTSIIVVSLPVSIYALMQFFHMDPLNGGPGGNRAYSTMGQPTFLADYLGMVIPLSLWRVASLLKNREQKSLRTPLKLSTLSFYAFVAILQLMALVASQSRGALWGLLFSILFLGLFRSLYTKRWRLILIELSALGLICVFLFLVHFHIGPIEPSMQRADATFTTASDGFRTVLWGQAPLLLTSVKPLVYPFGGTDLLHALRFWIGYGPETAQNILPQTFLVQPHWERIEDRFHDLVWDLFSSLGVFGIAAFLAFVFLLFYRVYAWLELIKTFRDQILFWAITITSGFIVAAVATWKMGLGYAGPGLLGGCIVGITCYPLLASRLRRETESNESSRSCEKTMILMALLAGLVAHCISMVFSFSTAASDELFWFYAGIIVALCAGPGSTRTDAQRVTVRGARATRVQKVTKVITGPWERNPIALSVFASLLVSVTLLFGFIHLYYKDDFSVWEILTGALVKIHGDQGPSHLILLLFLPTCSAVTFAFLSDSVRGEKNSHFRSSFLKALSISVVIGISYAYCEAIVIGRIGPFPTEFSPSSVVQQQCTGYQALFLLFLGIIIVILLMGVFLLAAVPLSKKEVLRQSAIPATLAGFVFLSLAWFSSVRVIHADMAEAWSQALISLKRPLQGLQMGREAVQERPDFALYHCFLAKELLEQTLVDSTGPSINAFIMEAERTLLEAQKLAGGLNLSSYQLGQLYLVALSREQSDIQRCVLVQKAEHAFQAALNYQPGSESVLEYLHLLEHFKNNQSSE